MVPAGTGNCGAALEYCVEITGADLGGGTKIVTMPIDTATTVCIEDKTGAEIKTACTQGEPITIPAPGDSVNVTIDGSDITITTDTAGTSITIEGLQHTVLVTLVPALGTWTLALLVLVMFWTGHRGVRVRQTTAHSP
jgi:hypothetical protein